MTQKSWCILLSVIFLAGNALGGESRKASLLCKNIFQNHSQSFLSASLENDFLVFWQSKESVTQIAEQLRGNSAEFLFRGIFLNLEDAAPALKNIVINGLETRLGQNRKIYLTEDPKAAIGYMWSSRRGLQQEELPGIRILIKVKRNGLDKQLTSAISIGIRSLTSNIDIPSSSIDSVYIFDKNLPSDFPFRQLSMDELKVLFGL